MADINVLDLTPTTPGSNDSLILFDRTTGEGKSTRFDTLSSQVLDSKFGDSSPTAGQELSYDATTGKYKNTSQIASLNEALTNLQDDLTNIDLTGTTNNTGSTITSGTIFYLNGTLVKAKTDIANGATFTLNTNYEETEVGSEIKDIKDTFYKEHGYAAASLDGQPNNSMGLQQFSSGAPFNVANNTRGAVINFDAVQSDGIWAAQVAILPTGVWLRTKWSSTTWSSWINTSNKRDLLYKKGIDTAGVLRHNYTDYDYILLVGKTNNDKTTKLIPKDEIDANTFFLLNAMASGTDGLVSDLGLKATCSIKFLTASTFEEHKAYVNANWQLSVWAIYGINAPIITN